METIRIQVQKALLLSSVLSLTLCGCAAKDPEHQRQERLWAQNEQRMAVLEKNVTQLNEQVSILNNRVYEVRGHKGKRTGLTVVPVLPHSPATPGAPAHQKYEPSRQNASQPSRKAPQQRHPQRAAQNRPVTPVLPPTNAMQKPTDTRAAAGSAPSPANPALPPALPPTGNETFALPPESAAGGPAPQPTLPIENSTPPHNVKNPAPAPMTPGLPAQGAQKAPQRSLKGEEASYKEALKLVRSGRSQEGIAKFNDFLAKYPNGKYAPNASFWMGEAYYSQGNYKEALNQYNRVNANYPKHHKNADALLKSGMTYRKLGDDGNAKASFETLRKQFPNSDAAKRARRGH
ncbi:MAG: tol-pal system protein YbgF [Desulfovibrio sp.]|nr:tol-pal system protein YbgF [Desulfovibrio sp.]